MLVRVWNLGLGPGFRVSGWFGVQGMLDYLPCLGLTIGHPAKKLEGLTVRLK